MQASTRLVGDIGGTNARFALVDSDSNLPRDIGEIRCADHASLIPAIETYLHERGNPALTEAVIAVGTPIVGDRLTMTNNHWSFSQREISATFGLEQLQFINDFTAQALSLPFLDAADLVQVGGGSCASDGPKAVLGPGTGLGVSGLIPVADGGWTPLQGEGGHVSLVPSGAREQAVVDWLAANLEEDAGHVSAERFLSGPGLEWIYQGLCAADGLEKTEHNAAMITAAAMAQTDTVAAEALAIFCRQLGAVASDLALTLGATGGVYIAGGIVPRLLDYFAVSEFRSAFENKGRCSDYLKLIATQVVVRKNPALQGAASLLST